MNDIVVRPQEAQGRYHSTSYILGPAFRGCWPTDQFYLHVERDQQSSKLPAYWAALLANGASSYVVNAMHNLFTDLFEDLRTDAVELGNRHSSHPTLTVHYIDRATPRWQFVLGTRHRQVKAHLETFMARASADKR